ncbi:MAG: DUF4367 domain-containing protein [Oscillospiraceae bacterium]|nr:DUF4367 domain-containing protein [Oscillospiraceae bacterium]
MTRREELYEACEDAIFALLMADFAEQEGRQLWERNQQLKRDPAFAVPEQSYQRGLDTIRRAYGAQRRSRIGRTAYGIACKVAIVALVLALMFTTAFAVSPTVQRGALSWLVRVTSVSADLSFVTPDEEIQLGSCSFPALPEGYTPTLQEATKFHVTLEAFSPENEMINMTVYFGNDTALSMDSQDADYIERVQINGHDGILIEKDGCWNIAYADLDQVAFVRLFCTGLSREEALSLIEQISIHSTE